MKRTRAPRPKWTKTYTSWDEVRLVLDSEEVAAILGYSLSTVKQMLRDGRIKGANSGNGWRVNKDELIRYLGGGVKSHD